MLFKGISQPTGKIFSSKPFIALFIPSALLLILEIKFYILIFFPFILDNLFFLLLLFIFFSIILHPLFYLIDKDFYFEYILFIDTRIFFIFNTIDSDKVFIENLYKNAKTYKVEIFMPQVEPEEDTFVAKCKECYDFLFNLEIIKIEFENFVKIIINIKKGIYLEALYLHCCHLDAYALLRGFFVKICKRKYNEIYFNFFALERGIVTNNFVRLNLNSIRKNIYNEELYNDVIKFVK